MLMMLVFWACFVSVLSSQTIPITVCLLKSTFQYFATNILVADYTEILSVTDEEFEKNLNTARKMRELLLSLAKK